MSGWIKVEKSTARKPEVLRIASMLGVHPDQAFGLCVRFWSWCDDHLTDGNARGVTESLIDSVLGCNGFAAALLEVDWLQVRSGSLVVPHFDRHLSDSAKNRALTAQRVATHKRKRGTGGGNASSVTSSSLIFSSLDVFLSSPLVPDELRKKEFHELWVKWEKHRREIKKALTATQVESQLKMLGKIGLSRAVAMIEHTIEKGWQGLREPEHGRERRRSAGVLAEAGDRGL